MVVWEEKHKKAWDVHILHMRIGLGKKPGDKWKWKHDSKIYFSCYLVTKLCPTLASPWMVACQLPLSIGFPRQQQWSGLPCPSPGDLLNPGSKPTSAWQGYFFTTKLPGIFLTQRLNSHLLHWKMDSLPLYQGSPQIYRIQQKQF